MSTAKKKYPVLRRLSHDNKEYLPDGKASVSLTEDQAAPLLKFGVIGEAKGRAKKGLPVPDDDQTSAAVPDNDQSSDAAEPGEGQDASADADQADDGAE